ncbi:MAG: lycopene cyclase domain-containing protein [Bacteroidetes bacterium]|nr:MAG: lycopene cyclase domain-containing protein [Bacteroidota bacterium]
MSTYLWWMLGSLIGPLLLSFDKKVVFYRSFKPLFLAILPVAFAFLVWDAYFTELEVWGFNTDHHGSFVVYNLPLEECLFFLIVPFCCVFIHEVLKAYFPNLSNEPISIFFSLFLLLFNVVMLTMSSGYYTVSACTISILLTLYFYFWKKSPWFGSFVRTYLVAIAPFLLVNGALTGLFTEEPIVWYSNDQITGFRVWTIPLEDFFYNYDLLLPIVAIFEYLKKNSETDILA